MNYFGIMKNLLAASAILLMVGCAPDSTKLLQGYSTEGLTYENTSVYYNGKLAATLASVEVALDDGKLVQEVGEEFRGAVKMSCTWSVKCGMTNMKRLPTSFKRNARRPTIWTARRNSKE